MYLIKLYREDVVRDRLKYAAGYTDMFIWESLYQNVQVDSSLVL